MFTHLGNVTPLMPGDVIVTDTRSEKRAVLVKRGASLLGWQVQPRGTDFWGYFCQLIKSPEDAEGAASALAAAAGHAIERTDDSHYVVVQFVPKKKKR